MLSKNNFKERLRKMEPRKERFSIRKFSIGAASVLIGFSFMSMAGNQKVQAATEEEPVVATKNTEQQSKTDGTQRAEEQSSAAAVNAQNNQAADAENVNATTTSNQNATDSKLTQSSAQDLSKDNVNSDSKNALDSTSEVKQNNKATQPETSTASTEVENNETAEDASASQTTNTLNINKLSATQAKSGSESVTPTNREIVSENKAKVEANNNIQSKAAMLSLVQESNPATQTETVTDYSTFLNALRNANTGTINLQNDIDFSNANLKHGPNNGLSGKYERLNNTGIARAVTINGNGHELKMGDRYIEFTSANQKNTDSNWDIQLKDLTLQTTSGYGPFWFDNTPDEADKNTITFNGVTTTADSHEIMWYNAGGASTTHVKFEGNNTINSTLNGNTAAIYAYSIEAVNGNTTFNVIDSSPANTGANRSAILISIDAAHAGKVIVDKGATLTINGDNQVNVPEMNSADSYGTMGIRFQNWAKIDLDKAKTSVVQVNGNLNLNMGKGGSTAILGSYVDVQPDGNVTINTQQNGTSTVAGDLALGHRGTHFGVIAGGIEVSDDYAGLRIANGGSLKIVRPTDVNSTQPLISYGDAGSSGGKTFTVNVENGGTLDLQDGATDPQTWSFSNTSSTGNTNMPWAGLITMWGTSGTNTIKINNPKYINLQRTGNQTGSLMRLEGTTNNVSINGDINNVITPLAQWDEGAKNNPSYYWYIENEANQNNWGNYANRFVQSGKNPQPAANAGVTTFMHSSGSVQMAPNQAGTNSSKFSNGEVAQTLNEAINYQAPYLNQFLNHFSWWAPQRIAMGSGLEDVVKPTDAEKYQPEVKTINGNTKQTLKDLTAKDGIKGLLSSDGTETTDLSSVKSVSWYDTATDATGWKSLMGDETEPTNPTGDLKTTDKSAWAKVTYTDGSIDFANIPLNITEPTANIHTPSYKPVDVEQGQSATDDPAFTDQAGKDATAPTGTTFTTGTDTPDWATIDPSTGTVTVKPDTNVTPGAYNVPVTVTYPDKSTDETTVPVIVTKAGQTVTWGDNGAVVTTIDTSKLNAHETTENSQVFSAGGVVTAEGYELTDGKLSTTATPITIDPSTVSWTTTPDTNVDTATASGKEITTSVDVDFTNNDVAKNILGSKNGVVTTNSFTIDAKGAGAKSVTAPVDIKLGSDLTSEQFGQLVDNNIPTDEIATTAWATKPNEQGQGGVIKITFTDKDANGNPTYLNINIPASSIKVTTDAEANTPQSQDVSTKVGEVPDAEKGIKNPGSLPSGTTYTWQYTPDTTKPGKKPADVVVTYPDGSKDTVSTNVIVNANPEIKTITTTVGGDPAATEGIANLNNGGTTPVDGYPTSATWTTKPDTSKPGAATGTAIVTYPDGTKETVTIPVTVNKSSQVTMTYDFYSTVTIDNPDGTSTTEPEQHIVFTYLGIPTDADVNVEFKNVAVPSFDGYTPQVSLTTPSAEGTPMATLEKGVDGKWTLKLPKPELSYPYYNYTISYKKSGSETPTDADKYTPEGQDVNTKTGVVPDPAEGIKNKSDLPDGTKYTWKETPAVTTSGDKPATVVVTYPDDSKDEVPVTIHVTNPTTPTDADKYTPEGQDVNTKTGVVPDPAEGIKNKGDLPDGTKYTWQDTPAVTTPGNKPATVVVTYPDGSKDEVPVTIHVTNPTTPTDADKYTPEGQDVNTKTGVIPDPAEGIKNKSDLPDGTKYTWQDTPAVTTPGNKPATVVVTYPDGSKDEVPVTIHVTNPTTPTTPTDADKYTPEGQDVNTKTGVVPDPAEGIKNKGDLPDGTKYTWKETPDVTTPGDKPAVVVVTYPDGSKDEVPVTIHVTNPTTPTTPTTPTDADKYTPEGQDVNTKTGVVPDPAEGIKNKGELPNGTTYTWKDTPAVTTPGDKPAVIVVTYPDGSKDEVPITIHVIDNTPNQPSSKDDNNTPKKSDADKNTPKGKDITVKQGETPNPADGIKNKGDLPSGTKYTWKNTPDTSTPGRRTATIVVTYPDGSQDEVTININVMAENSANNNSNTNVHDDVAKQNNAPQAQDMTVPSINSATNGTNVKAQTGAQVSHKNSLPQTGSNDNKAGIFGLAIATVGSLFGLAFGKKRKEDE